ncbi:CaiB/BaiF CoA transferase family protein [Thermodesulfobacteriota bacterium]
MTEGVLGGFQALDLTDEKGFLCGKLLADLGVDTIKIEKPGGDPARNIPPYYHDEQDPEKSLYWYSYNSNKRGITLNLETARGQDLLIKMVEKADFVIESFKPGYLSDLGLDYERISKINPGMIMTSITPFGQTGPYSGFEASDIVVQAMGVLLCQAGNPDRAPVRTRVPQGYLHAAADAAEAIMIAQYYRGQTGEGQYIDVSAMESVLWTAGRALPFWDHSEVESERTASLIAASGKYTPGIWECKEGYVAMVLQASLMGTRINKLLTKWMDDENMAPPFMKEMDWDKWDWLKVTQDELDRFTEAVSRFFKAHTADELEEESTKRGVRLHKICNSADTLANVQLEARGFWVDMEFDNLDINITYPGAFAKFSRTPMKEWRRAPLIGEHNEEVYMKELGISEQEFSALKSGGII